MTIFSYHLVKLSLLQALKRSLPFTGRLNVPGLIYYEEMKAMTLGAPLLSPGRVIPGQLAVFMQWADEAALDDFLNSHPFGRLLSTGYHVRLSFLRAWGRFTGFVLPDPVDDSDRQESPVVAVTLARMKPLAIPRFLAWGRPVEKLVRDHPGTLLSAASIRLPTTVSTFSIWKTTREMVGMVRGHTQMERPTRHADAMKERERKNFHFEFVTLRFRPLGEYGEWRGRSNYVINMEPGEHKVLRGK